MPKSKPSKNAIPPGATISASVTTSVSDGITDVHVHGPGGPLTSFTAKRGALEVVLPSVTIRNVSPGSWHVAWDGAKCRLMPTLESIRETDDLTLIGSITVSPSDQQEEIHNSVWSKSPLSALLADKISGASYLRKQQREEELEHERQLAEIRASALRVTENERPPLPRLLLDQIDLMLYKVDEKHFRHLADMQVPYEIPPGQPRPPRMPAQLLNQLQWYASVLFTREVQQYGSVRRDARYEVWLSRLADRLVARVVDAVEQVDKGSTTESLRYHGLSQDEMVAGLKESLSALVRKYVWEQSPEFLQMKAQMGESLAGQQVPASIPVPADDTHTQTDRKALRDSYRAMFPDVKIADIIWAAKQTRREWTRWINGQAKEGLKPDRSFKHVLTSGMSPEEIMGKPRPTKYTV